MSTPSGIFILGELTGPVAHRLHQVTLEADPKLGRSRRPHLTLAGSSGIGPIDASTPPAVLEAALRPVTDSTPPIPLRFDPPYRFPGTDIVVLPTDPHGPLRVLHDRIAAACAEHGIKYGQARFTFSPHVTLSLYRTLTPALVQHLMQVKVQEPVMLSELSVYFTHDPSPARLLFTLPLTPRHSGLSHRT